MFVVSASRISTLMFALSSTAAMYIKPKGRLPAGASEPG